jgi:hypothetical protein
MKKPSARRRSRSVRRARHHPVSEEVLNALRRHTRHLLALGGLLQACGASPRAEPVEVAMVAGTGELVLHEAGELLRLLAAAERAALRA